MLVGVLFFISEAFKKAVTFFSRIFNVNGIRSQSWKISQFDVFLFYPISVTVHCMWPYLKKMQSLHFSLHLPLLFIRYMDCHSKRYFFGNKKATITPTVTVIIINAC